MVNFRPPPPTVLGHFGIQFKQGETCAIFTLDQPAELHQLTLFVTFK
jgi:hypothetical protein